MNFVKVLKLGYVNVTMPFFTLMNCPRSKCVLNTFNGGTEKVFSLVVKTFSSICEMLLCTYVSTTQDISWLVD